MTTPSNGYSIRLELLKMAKEMLEQDWHASRDAEMQHYETLRSNMAEGQVPAKPVFKTFPTEEEIIKKAKVLNEFITTK